MTVAAGGQPEMQAYLEVVRDALADLPTAERDDLLAEVEASLAEAADEAEGPIAARLGPPQDFATELRTAAGLHAGAEPQRAGDTRVRDLADKLERWARRPGVVTARKLVFDLAPIWWAARGYLAVAMVAVITETAWSGTFPAVPRFFGDGEAGLLSIALVMAGSIWLGLRNRKRPVRWRHALTALNVVLLLTAFVVVPNVADASRANSAPVVVFQSNDPPPGLSFNGGPVENIYAYSRQGRLLHDVRLYDAAGNPLEVAPGDLDPLRRVLRTPSGEQIFNSFPIRYYEPGTQRVARPNAGPPVRTPRVVTPALRIER